MFRPLHFSSVAAFSSSSRLIPFHSHAFKSSPKFFLNTFKKCRLQSSKNLSRLSLKPNFVATNPDLLTTAKEDEKPQVPRKFVPIPFDYHQEIILRVSTLTNLGVGICRTTEDIIIQSKENPEEEPNIISNWVVMVPNVIPGELVKLKIYRNMKTYSEADLVEVIEPSPNRVESKCPLFQKCGGCQYQHIDIQTQREWKQEQVQDLLERVGGLDPSTFPPVLHTLGTKEIYHYRSKITPHYNAPKNQKFISAIGFKEKSSRRIVDVPKCYIATHAINHKLTELREQKQTECKEGTLRRPKKGATLLLRDVDTGVVTDNNEYVETTVALKTNSDDERLKFRFLAGNFFQNNPYMLSVMVEQVVKAATKPAADETEMTHLIDCYCGSGLFCLSTSKYFQQCAGIEVNAKAVDEACMNAELNNIQNCAFVAASAEAIFESDEAVVNRAAPKEESNSDSSSLYVRDFPRKSTVVVVDPPRKGCSEEFLDQLYKFMPQRVVYMSCDPATQARDAKGLVENGYEIVSAQPFDLFPQTRHIESLVTFERKTDR